MRELCDQYGTVLVFDEMITGFRWSEHGAAHLYGVTPDLSCWGKAMGNGFPVSALAGKRELMELGGLRTERERVFLLSSTHGAEVGGAGGVPRGRGGLPGDRPDRDDGAPGRRLAEGVNAAAATRA